jgi:hypothetical protein
MKARIKKTGEIVNIAEHATIELEMCDSYGDPICLCPEDIELIQEKTTEDEHWQEVRESAAIAAMQGTITILSNSDRTAFRDIVVSGFRGNKKTYPNEIAEFALACADALVEQLKKN